MRRLLLPLTLLLVACTSEPSYQPSINELAILDAVKPPAPELPPQRREVRVADQVSEFPGQAPDYPSPRDFTLNASSPEAFLQSLQAAEAALHPQVTRDLKHAIFVLTLRARSRFMQYAAEHNEQIPQSKVFEVAYSDLHGATVEQVVLQAAKHAQQNLVATN